MARVGAAAAIVAVVAVHIATIYTDSINWDEFSFFHRAARTLQTGSLRGGGRPGFAVLFALPFVAQCKSAIDVITAARLLWAAFTVAGLAGLFMLIRTATRGSNERARAAWLAVLSLACVPAYLRWSLQVRTDQLSVLFALWAGVALLAPSRSRALALLAGGSLGLGYACSQKAAYLAVLVTLLAVADAIVRREWAWARERGRAVAVGAGLLLAWVIFRVFVAAFDRRTEPATIDEGLKVFEHYRETIGFKVYRSMIPTLVPQFVLGTVACYAAIVAYRRRSNDLGLVITACAVLALGLGVGWFHAGAFPYFWMTLGLFPAVALGLAWPAVARALPGRRASSLVYWGAVALLAMPAVSYKLTLLQDTQRIQRESFAFVERTMPATARGFHPDAGLFCRQDAAPFRPYMNEHVVRLFFGADAQVNIDEFIDEFRSRPVGFIVETHRLFAFPEQVRQFWADHYVPYTARVAVPGRFIAGSQGTRVLFEALAPGTYRWHAEGGGEARLAVDGQVVGTGGTVELGKGPHALDMLDDIKWGFFVVALNEAPTPSDQPFHSTGQLAEMSGAGF